MSALPSKLRDRRIKLGFSLRDVEEITEGRISNAYLCQIETGKIKSPSLATACELAAAYAIPLETLREWFGMEAPAATPPLICPTCGQAVLAQGNSNA